MNNRNVAVNILRSWLEACSISHRFEGDTVQAGEASAVLDSAGVAALTSTDPAVSLNWFHVFTEKAGFGKPVPVDRGERPDKKVYGEPILARFRHTAFRGAPNNSEALQEWDRHLTRLARSFFNHNYSFFKRIGYEVDDIKSYLQVWTTTYVHRYVLPGGTANVENVKLLTKHLKQYFGELYRSLQREAGNVLPDHDAASMNHPGFYEPENAPTKEWKSEHAEIVARTPTMRKIIASEMLEQGLAAMPHDQMVTVLEQASYHPCPESAKLAAKKLVAHKASCDLCK